MLPQRGIILGACLRTLFLNTTHAINEKTVREVLNYGLHAAVRS